MGAGRLQRQTATDEHLHRRHPTSSRVQHPRMSRGKSRNCRCPSSIVNYTCILQRRIHRQQTTAMHFSGTDAPYKFPSRVGFRLPSNTWLLEPTRVFFPNGISIGSAVKHSSPLSVPILYNEPPVSPKIAPSLGGSGPHLIHNLLGPLDSALQTASRSVQPFSQGSRTWPTDRQTYTETHTDSMTNDAVLGRRALHSAKPYLGAASHVHHRRQSSVLGRCPTIHEILYPTTLPLPIFPRKLKWHLFCVTILSIVSWLLLLPFTPAVEVAVAVPLRPL